MDVLDFVAENEREISSRYHLSQSPSENSHSVEVTKVAVLNRRCKFIRMQVDVGGPSEIKRESDMKHQRTYRLSLINPVKHVD